MGVFVTGNNIKIGKNTVVNRNVFIDGRFGVEIGANCSISPDVYILSLSHNPNDPEFTTLGGAVGLGDRVWVGARAIILPGVKLGDGCVVGAGAIVTKSFPPYSIIAGVPAKFIAKRNDELKYELQYFPYFDTDITGH